MLSTFPHLLPSQAGVPVQAFPQSESPTLVQPSFELFPLNNAKIRNTFQVRIRHFSISRMFLKFWGFKNTLNLKILKK